MTEEIYREYLAALRGGFTKIAKLDFLNPDGGVAFSLDNNPLNRRSGAFLQGGSITCNLNNGRRRQATVTLANIDGDYEYAVNKIWFGQLIQLWEGLLLPDGREVYLPQGVFGIENPGEVLKPDGNTVTYQLTDKWAFLDGTLGGNLEGAYSIEAGTNIMSAMASLLRLDRFDMSSNGANPIDPVKPNFTSYYNGKTQTLTDGRVVNLTDAPYDFISSDEGTLAEVELGLAKMLAAWIGYNQTGRLTLDPSQDDILDISKPVAWEFKPGEAQLMEADYEGKPGELFNDIIVVGDTNDRYATAKGRAQNLDPSSDSCVSRIGLKTKRIPMQNYYSNSICEAYAEWMLKRAAVMSKSVTIKCTQMFHIVENEIITLRREDKPGNPVERHLIQGFTRPIGQNGEMTINCVSVQDFPTATIVNNKAYVESFVFKSENGNKRTYTATISDGTVYEPEFEVNAETGMLSQIKPADYVGPEFSIVNGHLEAE